MKYLALFSVGLSALISSAASAEVYNLKVLTDASPDYSDMPSMIHSITSKFRTPEEKCWAVYYWSHIARRQTTPMQLHGLELTDPIRQFNDYGYTMCSTIAGINCAIWHNMGLKARFWDISLHTVSEVFYDGRWHMYDNSMSALYTLCDGRTLAGVEDIGKEGACAVSGGESERGHVAKYHCLYATGPNGFLTGADTQRSLDEESRCFNPNALKHRYYYFNWDYGHRYILNLKANESYTRYYTRQGTSPDYYVPNHDKDPDNRYALRGNGLWRFHPELTRSDWEKSVQSARNVTTGPGGLMPARAGEMAEVIFKVQGANVIASQKISAALTRRSNEDQLAMAISTNNGLKWDEVWKAGETAELKPELRLQQLVNGAYEALIKITMVAAKSPADVSLEDLDVQTITMLNAKTQPRLNIGKNAIYVGAGPQNDSIVFWPELQGNKYKQHIVEEKNIASVAEHIGYQGAIYPKKASEEAYVVYRMDAPRQIARLTFGGRFYNRAPKSRIDLLFSTDDGKTWTTPWSLRKTSPPWDVIHYETVKIPPGRNSVLVKYLMHTSEASPAGCSIYALRMEAEHAAPGTGFSPLEVTFNWSERQQDRSLVERSHRQTIPRLPFKYTVNVGGADHPVMNSLRVAAAGGQDTLDGYSDGKDSGGEKFIPQWVTAGRNLALGKSYTLSIPSGDNWGAGDDGKKLTSGAGGPSYAGGTSYRSGALWMQNANPAITVDLGAPASCASFGLNFHGYPWWDALKGEVQDKVEVLTSVDGKEFTPQGFLHTDIRWKELPVNYMWTDEETMTSATFRYVPQSPISVRFVKFQITNKRILDCAGIEVLDNIRYEPFDLRIALPDEGGPAVCLIPADDGTEPVGQQQ